jgi:hypothetical protein
MRAMSVGAGEFSKIIGTQDMGVSQLMSSVDKFSTTGQKGLLNTMKLGGAQDKSETAAGVGGEYMGQYSATPGLPTASFQNADTYQRGLRRYAGYDESVQKTRDSMIGKGARSRVGSANALTEQYEGALRGGAMDASEQYTSAMEGAGFESKPLDKKESTDATYDALVRFEKRPRRGGYNISGGGVGFGGNKNIMGGISPVWTSGNGPPGAAMERINRDSGWSFGGAVAYGARGSSPANPSPFTRGGVVQPYDVPTDMYGMSPGLPTGRRSGKPNPDYWSNSGGRLHGDVPYHNTGWGVDQKARQQEMEKINKFRQQEMEKLREAVQEQMDLNKNKSMEAMKTKNKNTLDPQNNDNSIEIDKNDLQMGAGVSGLLGAAYLAKKTRMAKMAKMAAQASSAEGEAQLLPSLIAKRAAVSEASQAARAGSKIGGLGKFGRGAGKLAAGLALALEAKDSYGIITDDKARGAAEKEAQEKANAVNDVDPSDLWGRTKAIGSLAFYGATHASKSGAGLGSAMGTSYYDKKYGVEQSGRDADEADKKGRLAKRQRRQRKAEESKKMSEYSAQREAEFKETAKQEAEWQKQHKFTETFDKEYASQKEAEPWNEKAGLSVPRASSVTEKEAKAASFLSKSFNSSFCSALALAVNLSLSLAKSLSTLVLICLYF